MANRPGHSRLTRTLLFLGAVAIACALASGCAGPRHFSLLDSGAGRFLLVPPRAKPVDSFTTRAAHAARYGNYVENGFVDLQPGMRLRVVKPITAGGAPLKTETAGQQQQGLTLTVRSNVTGVDVQHWLVRDSGAVEETGFGSTVRHLRLFFQARDLDSERKITLIGATTKDGLDRATASLDAYCKAPSAPCLSVSPGMAIGAEIEIAVNGVRRFVPLGAHVREVASGKASLQLERHWRGKPVPVRPGTNVTASALLGLPLNGGDSILE